MKIGTKLGLIVILFITLSFITILGILSTVTESNFNKVENSVHQSTMKNMYEILISDIEKLELLLADWAEWDATLDYIRGDYPEYIEENIPIEVFEDNNIDYIVITNDNKELLYGKELNLEEYELMDIEENLISILTSFENKTGVVEYNKEYIFFSSTYITDNSGVILSDGKMIHAFKLSDEFLYGLNEALDHMMEVTIEDKGKLIKSQYDSVVSEEDSEYNISSGLITERKNSIGQLRIPIDNTDRYIVLSTNLDNSIYNLGQKQKQETSIMVLSSLALLMVIMSLAIRRIIVERVEKLNHEVDAITISGNVNERVKTKGRDELGKLSDGINMMLAELEDMHQEVSRLASYDALTGIYNRRYGYEMLNKTLEIHKKNEKPISVAFIDIDNLKVVNDTLGHNEGDQLIFDVVSLLKEKISNNDYIIRLGGDEFLYVMHGKSKNEASELIQSLKKEVVLRNQEENKNYKLNFSYGIASYQSEMTLDEFVEEADRLMYLDKKRNKEYGGSNENR